MTLDARLRSIQTGNADPLRVLATLPGTERDEVRLHRYFASLRRSGEWFDFGEQDAVEAVAQAHRDGLDAVASGRTRLPAPSDSDLELLRCAQALCKQSTDFVPSQVILDHLLDSEGEWTRWTARAISMRLSQVLAHFEVYHVKRYVNGRQCRGYWRDDLALMRT